MKSQQGNKLICKFMGYKFDPKKKDGSPFYNEFKDGAWESKNYFNPIRTADINNVFDAFVDFILWYNTNNPKTPPHAK